MFTGIKAYVYGAVATVILILLATTYIAIKERDHARVALAEYQASAAAVIAERLAAQQAEADRNIQRTQEVVSEYKAKLARVNKAMASTVADRDAVAERLRNALATRAPVPGTPAAPGGTDGGPGRDTLLAELAGCVKNTEQLKALQDWIRRTH